MNGINSATSAKFFLSQNGMSTNRTLKQLEQKLAVDQKNTALKEDQLREVSADFESLFLSQMLNVMRGTVEESELLPGSHGEKVFRSMLDQEFAKAASKTGSLGLGEMIYKELKPSLGS